MSQLTLELEKKRTSKNPLWKPLVWGKDFIWAISNLDHTSFYWEVLIYIEKAKNKIRQMINRPHTDKIMWIICGPSCIGKSTFLKSKRCVEITNLPPKKVPIILTDEYSKSSKPDNINCYLHLGVDFFEGSNLSPSFFYVYRKIMKTRTHKKAIILATSKEILLERLKKRLKKGTSEKMGSG